MDVRVVKDSFYQTSHSAPVQFIQTTPDLRHGHVPHPVLHSMPSHGHQARLQRTISWFLEVPVFGDEVIDESTTSLQRGHIPRCFVLLHQFRHTTEFILEDFCDSFAHFQVLANAVGQAEAFVTRKQVATLF